ncbi:MAG: glycosyltransferase family 39 protein [Alphaproteobacteria bacterium]|nr:glycosyltransferase family 39 protein [Alphaproteobacteria bacterium]
MTGLAVLLAAAATLSVHGAVMVAFIDRFADYVRYPFDLDYAEGPILYQLAKLTAGESLYQPVSQAPYTVSNYPPVYHYVVWLVNHIIGDSQIAGRIISLAGSLVSALLIFTLVRGALHKAYGVAHRNFAGLLAALYFLAHFTVIGWSAMMRVDTLALTFGLLGMQLFVLSLRYPSLAWLCGLSFVLAAYTKPNVMAAALATFGVGLLVARPQAIRAFAVTFTVGLSVLAVVAVVTDGEFLRHVFLYNINEIRMDLFYWRMRETMAWRTTDVLLLFFSLAWLGTWLVRRRRKGPEAAPLPELSFILFGSYLAASLINVLGSAKNGSSVSYFLEFEAASSLLVGALTVRFSDFLRRQAWGPDCWRLRFLGIFALAVLCWQATFGWHLKFTPPDWSAVANSQHVVDIIADADGPVVSEEMSLLYRSGQPLYFQPFIMTRLERDGRWDSAPFTSAMERGEIPFVVLYGAIGSVQYYRRFPEKFQRALETRYRQLGQYGHLAVYVPK